MVEGVVELLLADTAVTSLLPDSKKGTPRIYPVIAEQNERFPYVVVTQTAGVGIGKNCGFEGSYTVIIYNKNFDPNTVLLKAIIGCLTAGKNTIIDYSNLSNVADQWVKADGDGLYAKVISFDCAYNLI